MRERESARAPSPVKASHAGLVPLPQAAQHAVAQQQPFQPHRLPVAPAADAAVHAAMGSAVGSAMGSAVEMRGSVRNDGGVRVVSGARSRTSANTSSGSTGTNTAASTSSSDGGGGGRCER